MKHWLGLIYLTVLTGGAILAQTPTGDNAAGTPRRVALILANSAYKYLPALPSARADSNLIEDALKKAGFETETYSDDAGMLPGLAESIENRFVSELRTGDVCLIYYVGYVLQNNGGNYIVPIDYDPALEQASPIYSRTYSLSRLQQLLDDHDAGLKIFVIEALNTSLFINGATGRGLASPNSGSSNTAFAFSVVPGKTSDGSGFPRDTFSEAIAANISKTPGVTFEEIFRNAQSDLSLVRPDGPPVFWLSNFTGEFYFQAPERKVITGINRRDREEYVLVPRSEGFLMGCVPKDTMCLDVEKPRHLVRITKNFWMGAAEVDVTGYMHFVEFQKEQGVKTRMPTPPLGFNKKWSLTNHPIVNVSWEDAAAFCRWAGGRLPTEAEWEYAARANHKDEVYPHNSENSRDKANFYGVKGNDIWEFTAPVKSFDPNDFGLFDMAGNVWEWLNDFFAPDYYMHSAPLDPPGPESGKAHVVRGGSFDSDPEKHLRISFRSSKRAAENNVGFRCVVEADPEASRAKRFVIQ